MGLTAAVIDFAVVASGATALLAVPRVIRRPLTDGLPMGRSLVPGAALALVIALIYLNQVLLTVYIIRVHGGDVSFVARSLPEGWFATATDNATLAELARHFPFPELLAPTVLRVQAFL